MNTTTLTFKFAHYAIPKGCKVGDRVILVRHTNTLKNHSSYSLVTDDGEGYPDNNCGYKAYHGFRGSFNDVATVAEGAHEILSMEVTKMDSYFKPRFEDDFWGEEIEFPGEYLITLSEDLVPDEE